jgi:hypothetical protein
MRVEEQTTPSRTHLTETDVVLFSTKFGMFELEDNRKIELMLTSNTRSIIVGTHGLLTYRKNRALEGLNFFSYSGVFELEDSFPFELVLNSKVQVVEIDAQGELICRNNHALDFIVEEG